MDGSRYIAVYLIILLAQREENIVPPFSRRNLCKTKKARSAFFIFCRNWYTIEVCLSSFDASRYCGVWLIVLLAQREENIVPPFLRRNPLINLSGVFIVMASTMVPCRSVLLAQREWNRNRSFVRIRFRHPTSAQLSRAVKADEISVVEPTQPLRLDRQSKNN